MPRMQHDEAHALVHALRHPLRGLVRNLAMRLVPPPDEHVRLVEPLARQAVSGLVERRR